MAVEFSPAMYFPSGLTNVVAEAVGDESMKYVCNIKKAIDGGLIVAAGSDWPTGNPDANPLKTLHVLVTRQNPFGEYPGEVVGEPISLEDGIRLITLGGAYTMRKENELGSIEPGKAADMVVLNQNLFTIDPMSIIDTRVAYIIFAGEIVYEAKSVPRLIGVKQ